MTNSEPTYKIGDKVDVHDEVGTIVKVKGKDLYEIRFHYGTVEVHDDDIEGISSHVQNAATCTCGDDSAEHRYGTSECLSCDCKKFKVKNADDKCSICGKHVPYGEGRYKDDKVVCSECTYGKIGNTFGSYKNTQLTRLEEGRVRYGRRDA